MHCLTVVRRVAVLATGHGVKGLRVRDITAPRPHQVQKADFEANGFLVLEDAKTAEECDQLRAEAQRLVESFDVAEVSVFTTNEQTRHTDDYFLSSGNEVRFFFEENAFKEDGSLKQDKNLSINKIGHGLHNRNDLFNRFTRTEFNKNVAISLGYEQPVLLQSMYIFKQPNIGGEVNAHQDQTFLFTDPPSTRGYWWALEDATKENGCLWAIPASHQDPALAPSKQFQRNETNDGTVMVGENPDWDLDQMVPLEVKKGSLVLLHGNLVHMSYENTSPKSRHAYAVHCIEGKYDYSPKNWLQGHQKTGF